MTIYVLGSTTQAIVILAGISGDADSLDARSAAYVLAFPEAAGLLPAG